eukprot:CAMPEP_0183729642 /NCGR_PEP_ID=MMETSP0737-20130205/30800_1 /TAXON_ID=385413 /ORGANISM="Thalassiosira miniscula, Strain CCMP1093" /LENGTH=435 /DNA_ID=CAMNT_0025961881 /DNA_START=405 /DNA_END=1712 /DNA_ORIENTATION=-
MAKSVPSPTNVNRHKVLHNYHDHAQASAPAEIEAALRGDGGGSDGDKRKGPRGGVTIPFPTKLHAMLSKAEQEGFSDVVSWQPHGRCFLVHKPKEFVSEVMPLYFRQSKLTSFQRQLNLYGFSRITTGRDRGGYYHEFFLKQRLFLCQKMSRMRIKGTGIKGKASPETEPNFYSMPWVKDDPCCALNRDLEGEVTAAIKEENRCSEPIPSSIVKRQERGSKKKQDHNRKDPKRKHFQTDNVPSSPRAAQTDLAPPAVVTPGTGNIKKPLSVPSSFQTCSNGIGTTPCQRLGQHSIRSKEKRNLACIFPPLLSSDSEDSNNDNLHAGDEVAFEGQHFHYLDSYVAQCPPSSFVLGPKKNQSKVQPSTAGALSSDALSLRGPILTPSSSTSSLNDVFEQDDSLDLNPDTIFSESGFCGDWTVGGCVDIDNEFKLLEG